MSAINIHTGTLARKTREAYQGGATTIMHRGGTASGKTYDIMIYLIFYVALKVPGKVITIVSESYPHLKIGTIRYCKELLAKANLLKTVKENKTENTFLFPNGTVIEFFSADRIEKALGARRYLLYGNEINSLKYEVWDELARRSEIVIGDFNPTMQFWLEEKFLPFYEPNVVIKSNYLDNPYCPDHEKARIAKRASLDSNFKRVHIDCEYGNAEDLVFEPKNIILIDEFPKDVQYDYGMDFGWTAPSTLMKVGMIGDDIYIDEIFYAPGMNEANFKTRLEPISKKDRITADSEDSRMINYIYSQLHYNVHAAKKAAGSVLFGISFLQGKRLNITKSSIATIKEFRNLMNGKDKQGMVVRGKYEGDDHSIDAVRYSIEHKTSKKETKSW